MKHKTFLENDDQFIVSYQLLYILQWLITYEKEAFSNLVHKAFIQGSESLQEDDIYDQMEEADYLQSSVIDFFSFLEDEIENVTQAESIKLVMQKKILEMLDHIDPKLFDPAIVQASMMATAEKLNPESNHLAKDLFLKQFLKKWNPKKDKNKRHSLH